MKSTAHAWTCSMAHPTRDAECCCGVERHCIQVAPGVTRNRYRVVGAIFWLDKMPACTRFDDIKESVDIIKARFTGENMGCRNGFITRESYSSLDRLDSLFDGSDLATEAALSDSLEQPSELLLSRIRPVASGPCPMSNPSGFFHVPGFLSAQEQLDLLEIAREICREAPLQRPTLTNGTPMKLTLTNAGPWGWWADKEGYRYMERHPSTGKRWPAIPTQLRLLAMRATDHCGLVKLAVENLLINHYEVGESLGMHIDRTEKDLRAPIISFSIGADAEFVLQDHVGGKKSYILRSGDLVVQSGYSRGWLHGIKKVMATLPNICKDGGRLNFTLRKVMP